MLSIRNSLGVVADGDRGALMAAAVLNSPRAVEMSIFVVRASSDFVTPRGVAADWRRASPCSSEESRGTTMSWLRS
jgi:hypothetical protein